MNNQRRKQITKIIDRVSELSSMLEELTEMVEDVKDEEQDALDNMPENLMGSDRYTQIETAVENLESAYDWFTSVDIEELLQYLEYAKQ